MNVLLLFSHEKVRLTNSVLNLVKSYRDSSVITKSEGEIKSIEWTSFDCIIVDIDSVEKIPVEVKEYFEDKIILLHEKEKNTLTKEYLLYKNILFPKEKELLLFQIDSLRDVKIPNTASPKIFIRTDGNYKKIEIKDILYVEGLKDYVRIKTINNQFIVRISIKYIQSILNNKEFIRVHKSYIVNLEKIDEIYPDSVKIFDKLIPIGRYSKKDLLDAVILI